MIDIAVNNIKKAFELDKNILDGLSFEVNEGERVGLLGKNGAGKTTLFRIIAGEYESDEGTVVLGTGKRIGLISQIPIYPESFTTEDVLNSAFRLQFEIKAEMEELEHRSSEGGEFSADRYDRLAAEFMRLEGYETGVLLNKVANGLDITPSMREQLFSTLSGGEKTRVNLARLILEKTDILLLDEPTNHLDMRSAAWLEAYLAKFKGTVLVISHDRYFLDAVVTRIVEIVAGKAEFYSGNYSFYAEEKRARYEEGMKRYELREKEAKRLDAAADRLYMWGTGNKRLMKKSFAIKKRVERLRSENEKPAKERQIKAKFGEKSFFSDELIVIKELKKGFENRILFSGIDIEVSGAERIALIGDNGTGKTTFLNILLGNDVPDYGIARLGPAVRFAFLPQIVEFENPNRSVLDTVIFETGCTPQTARNRLGAFKFSGEDVFKPVSILSGGERSRLRLCILMKDEINLLVLDEPTNHLDIDSREWIEDAIENYEEALLFVSHDRYFIDRFATRIWELNNGEIIDFKGDYEQYLIYKQKAVKTERIQKEVKRKQEKKTKPISPERRLELFEKAISDAELRLKVLEAEIIENSSDYVKLTELYEQRSAIETELDELYCQWDNVADDENK